MGIFFSPSVIGFSEGVERQPIAAVETMEKKTSLKDGRQTEGVRGLMALERAHVQKTTEAGVLLGRVFPKEGETEGEDRGE